MLLWRLRSACAHNDGTDLRGTSFELYRIKIRIRQLTAFGNDFGLQDHHRRQDLSYSSRDRVQTGLF
jgi:hypothetical protein